VITLLDPAGYLRTPWKNGGGTTVDIAFSGECLAVRPHADHDARPLLRLFRQ